MDARIPKVPAWRCARIVERYLTGGRNGARAAG